MAKQTFSSIDDYHALFEDEAKQRLDTMRAYLREALPDAQEVISYNMPAFKQKQVLVYYAANKKHIGFYPTAQPIVHFADALKAYPTSKGAIQFPLNADIPKELVQTIARYRLQQVASAK